MLIPKKLIRVRRKIWRLVWGAGRHGYLTPNTSKASIYHTIIYLLALITILLSVMLK